MQFVIQMADGSYYLEPADGVGGEVIFTTGNLNEATRFRGRFEALVVMASSSKFAGSTIRALGQEQQSHGGVVQ